MPWIIGGAVIGSSLIGGASSYAGGQAASSADKYAANLQNQQYQQTRQDFAPWRTAGAGAVGQINALLGLGGSQPNAFAGSAPSGQSGGMTPGMIAAQAAGPHSKNTLAEDAMWGGIDPFRKNASSIQDIAAAMKNGTPITDAQWAQAGFGPGGAAPGGGGGQSIIGYNPDGSPQYGNANAFMTGGPDAATAQQNAFASFRADPGYQFAFDQGQKALTNSAATRGILNSGATAKALTNYGQGMADQQYGNYFARLQSLAGLGRSATGSTAQAGATAASNAGNAFMQAGNARSSAYGGIAQAGNQGIQNYLLSNAFGGGGGYATYGGGNWTPGPQGFPLN